MSDSDEDAAFASADEGETSENKKEILKEKSSEAKAAAEKKSETKTTVKKTKKKPLAEKGGATKSSPEKKSSVSAEKKPAATLEEKSGKSKKETHQKSAKSASGKREEKTKNVEKSPVKKSSEPAVSQESKTEKNVKDSQEITSVGHEETKVTTSPDDTAGASEDCQATADKNAEITKTSSPDTTENKNKDNKTLEADSPQKTQDSESTPGSDKQTVGESGPSSYSNKQATPDSEPSASKKQTSGGWNWGSWSSSLVEAATNSVTTFTSQVEEGFNTLVDAVETSLGAPTPEELAEMQAKKPKDEEPQETNIDREEKGTEKPDQNVEREITEEKQEENVQTEESKKESEGSWFSSWGVSSLTSVVQKSTNMVQNTSKNLVTGGLDVLETIGKKTFSVIQDHDPGLRKTKEVLLDRGDKPNLSAVLREAQEEAQEQMQLQREADEMRKAHFGSMFDEYQGVAHLEALEILSNRSEKKVHSLLSSMPVDTLADIKSDLIKIKKVFEWEEDLDEDVKEQDFKGLISTALSDIHTGTTPSKLYNSQEKMWKNISAFDVIDKDEEKPQPKAIHQLSIQSLAEITSKAVEQFHKAGELILLQKDSNKEIIDCAKSLESLTRVLCTEVSLFSTKCSACLNKIVEENDDFSVVNPLVTNIYLEAGNSSTYMQDAFQLLLPCLQEAALEKAIEIKS